MLESAITGLANLLAWPGPLLLVLGVLIGSLFGILPGLGGPQVLALLLPVTMGMTPSHAIILLIGALGAVPFTGSLSAILINTPGTPQSAATCLDGFPLARQGKAGMAIGASACSSLLGALFGCVILTVILPVGRQVVLAFSYPEYFMLAMLGLSVVAVVSQGSLWKGLIAAILGLMLSSIGYDPITGATRYAFGIEYLWDGIKLIPALIGLFAIGEAVELFIERGAIARQELKGSIGNIIEGVKAVFKNFSLFMRSSLIGTIIGIIPGVGGAVANFIAYIQAAQTCKNGNFGRGDIRGVIAPEAANNAKDGGALVPTLIFGIPGSVETAVLLGALIIHGVQPGPRLMLDNPELVLTLIYALVFANIIVTLIGLATTRALIRITVIPGTYVAALVFVLAVIGSYAYHGIFYDTIVTLTFGVLGFVMKRFGFSRVALVLALMLGEMAQKTFHQTLISMGPVGFFTRPISLVLFIFIVVILFTPYIRNFIKGGRTLES